MEKIKVLMSPVQRQEYLDKLLKLDGLGHIKEDENAAYCPISLTSVPEELKAFLKERQRILMEDILSSAGIVGYDPGSSPFSPDVNLAASPKTVYNVDTKRIVEARFFIGHDLLPSDGKGIEREKASRFNRIAVMLIDKNIRVSRMHPHRTIYLQYENLTEQASEFILLFEMLKRFDPGMGFNEDGLPILIGFPKDGGEPIDLEKAVYEKFPNLQYHYNGEIPILKLRAENPGLFYEHSSYLGNV